MLLISQFWTLANIVYDPRQAKRLFGFIGGGAPLGGIAGSALAASANTIGSINLILPGAALMALSAVLVTFIITREKIDADPLVAVKTEKGVSATEALDLLRKSKHLQIIALVISFAAIGASIIDQQLSMAAQAAKGAQATDSITAFLATVGLWTSSIGFVIQVWLDQQDPPLSRHRVRPDDPPDQPRFDRRGHAAQRRALGAGAGARDGPVAALHGRQDHPRDPVPAARPRHQAEGEILRRRHRRSRREGARRAAAAGPGETLGAAPVVAAAQLSRASRSPPCGS